MGTDLGSVLTSVLGRASGENIVNDVPVDVGEAAVYAVVAEGQLFVVDAEQVENGGVEVVAVGRRYSFPGPLIAFTVGDATLDACSGKPGDERAAIVVAARAA